MDRQRRLLELCQHDFEISRFQRRCSLVGQYACQAAILLGSPLIRQGGTRIAEILGSRRIPAISQFRTFPDGGGLMSYGPDLVHLYRRLGPYVAKILHGARPADLPIERPTKFEFVVNLKAAKALDVTVPGSLLMNADEVIE